MYGITRVSATVAGGYRVVIRDQDHTLLSETAALSVTGAAPEIAVPPQSQTVKQGGPAVFAVEAAGSPPLRYQWRKGGQNIPGATNRVYSLASAQPADAGAYDVAVANPAGSAQSSVAALIVQSAGFLPGPRLDLLADGSNLSLRYQVGAEWGVVSVFGFDRVEAPRADRALLATQLLPPGGAVILPLPNWQQSLQRYFNMEVQPADANVAPSNYVWIPPGEFIMGSPEEELDRESDEGPAMRVKLSQGFWLGKCEVTQQEYSELMNANPSAFTGDLSLPVEQVSWADATNYCACLTLREQQAGRLPLGYQYRLPTEAEWEYAARAGSQARFNWGDDADYSQLPDYAWCETNAVETTHPVSGKRPNSWGLYDMYGNVAEWCADWYGDYPGGTVTDPTGPPSGDDRVMRGGSYADAGEYCRSAFRLIDWTESSFANVGFRVALAPVGSVAVRAAPSLVWIAPGSFTLGSPDTEAGHEWDEGPEMHVTIGHGFFMGAEEVTQAAYEMVMGANPSYYAGFPNRSVEQVSWTDAVAFCDGLTALERAAGRLPKNYAYRLPTEAEWEYAARAGSSARFSFGDDPGYALLGDYGWCDVGAPPRGVGGKLPNAWGLYDMYGNVAEWCSDWYDWYPGGVATDPKGPATGDQRVIRGGSYLDTGSYCRSAFRLCGAPVMKYANVGFRYVLAPSGEAFPPAPMELELIWVGPGAFVMGSPDGEADREADEGPLTRVTISCGYWLGKYEVTREQHAALTGSSPPAGKPGVSSQPVQNVSWADAADYCRRLTFKEQSAGRLPAGYEYRLPTEAEWEYAARAGTTNRFSFGDDPLYELLGEYACFLVAPVAGVGSRQPSPWGFYDLYGNVAEWCYDYYGPYPGGSVTNPFGPMAGTFRVNRGGGYDDSGQYCRSAFRGFDLEQDASPSVGFRVALAPAVALGNALPIELAWIAPGTFTLGSPNGEADRDFDEGPQTQVTLSRGFWLGKFEVTQAQYQQLMATNPSCFVGLPSQPVEEVSWDEAVEFCARLTAFESQAGRLPAGYAYRLPTEAEWEYAARAGSQTRFNWGDDPGYQQLNAYAWVLTDSGFTTRAVGQKPPNAWGLYDMIGNVAEWCADWYGDYPGGEATDPTGPPTGEDRVIRGGSYIDPGQYCRPAFRLIDWTADRFQNVGFRVALSPVAPPPEPLPLEMVWIPPGAFVMGSPGSEADRQSDEGPLTAVTLTHGFLMSKYEVTQGQYLAVTGANPSYFGGYPNLPVEQVSWQEARAFCAQLTARECQAGRIPTNMTYRLPTEAEWEYAARAANTNRFSFGDDPGYRQLPTYAWVFPGSLSRTHGVGSRLPNAWGLYDVYGNVAEWCLDWYAPYPGGAVTDPTGPATGDDRVIRGGSWFDEGQFCRSACRLIDWTGERFYNVGFRVVLVGEDDAGTHQTPARPAPALGHHQDPSLAQRGAGASQPLSAFPRPASKPRPPGQAPDR
jgi:formylglycine-generating enzyme required for sulfatase activity